MIWLTWRQFRIQALTGAVVLAVVAATLLATRPGVADRYARSGLATCTTGCDELARTFFNDLTRGLPGALFIGGIAVLFLLPALVGVFWGAPLVARELEGGTFRLVWAQSIGRVRWLLVKLAGLGLATVLLSGLISLLVTWWSGPFDKAQDHRIEPLLFAARGVVPLGHAALAFVIGVLVGLITRRTLTAMAFTLLFVVSAQLAMPYLVRPAIASPVHAVTAFEAGRIEMMGIRPDNSVDVLLAPPVTGAWVLSNATIDKAGKVFHGPVDETMCGRDSGPKECEDYLASLGLRQDVTYVPPRQFWELQWRELGVLAGVTALLTLLSVWWIRRRTT